ncbi:hypothetical protein B0H13DRAFT_2496182 [Mycena leptocephala]|nr:hypothetical protein B0H13DRAFT_2496182 [Mycena leptocephala]
MGVVQLVGKNPDGVPGCERSKKNAPMGKPPAMFDGLPHSADSTRQQVSTASAKNKKETSKIREGEAGLHPRNNARTEKSYSPDPHSNSLFHPQSPTIGACITTPWRLPPHWQTILTASASERTPDTARKNEYPLKRGASVGTQLVGWEAQTQPGSVGIVELCDCDDVIGGPAEEEVWRPVRDLSLSIDERAREPRRGKQVTCAGGGDRTRRKGIRTPGGPDFIRRARLIAGDGCLDHTGRSAVEVGPVGCSPDTISVAIWVNVGCVQKSNAGIENTIADEPINVKCSSQLSRRRPVTLIKSLITMVIQEEPEEH